MNGKYIKGATHTHGVYGVLVRHSVPQWGLSLVRYYNGREAYVLTAELKVIP